MHRNTAILIAFLAIISALLIGITVGRKLSGEPIPVPTPTPLVNIQATPSPTFKTFSHKNCGVTFEYPASLTLTEASDSAQLNQTGSTERITMVCGVDFPKPPLPPEKITEATVAGQLVTIYHDASAKDGTPVDVVVFTHPKNHLEIGLFGFGEVFEGILKTIILK